MASEDSVEDLLLWDPPILATTVDGVGKPDDSHQTFDGALPPLFEELHHAREDLIVLYTRREAHVAAEEWNHAIPKDATVTYLQNEHILIPRFGEDAARAELLRSHLEETSSVPVLIQKELRLDEIAEG